MNSINYFKLDINLIKESMKRYLFVPLFVILFFKTMPTFVVEYLFFILIIFATIPFYIESNERCDKLYYLLPSKISEMVLGRFLYLLFLNGIAWIVSSILTIYMYKIEILTSGNILVLSVSGIATTVISFIQYPIYYKVGVEKGKILSMLIYMVPAFILLALPSLLTKHNFLTGESLNYIINFITINKTTLPLLILVIIGVIGIISYLVSCFICERKEI